jgi:tetratricopeptide (TPR) repeat protein
VLAEKLGDLYEAQGKPSSAVVFYQRALALNPSPQQRLRLRLTLGDKLPALDQEDKGFNGEAEAYQNYQNLLQECPNYPDKLAIYPKLLPLARKLGKTADAENYDNLIKSLTAPNK